MIIGLDFYDTITRKPEIFRQLSDALCRQGNKVHIISAVRSENITRLLNNLKKSGVEYTSVNPVVYKEHSEIPQLKLEKALELGIDIFFDDMKDVCDLLNQNGIISCLVVGGSFDKQRGIV